MCLLHFHRFLIEDIDISVTFENYRKILVRINRKYSVPSYNPYQEKTSLGGEVLLLAYINDFHVSMTAALGCGQKLYCPFCPWQNTACDHPCLFQWMPPLGEIIGISM